MGAYVSLAALTIQLVFLALVLSFVGYGVNKLINFYLDSRRDELMKAEALKATTRNRSKANAKVSAISF